MTEDVRRHVRIRFSNVGTFELAICVCSIFEREDLFKESVYIKSIILQVTGEAKGSHDGSEN